MLTAEQAVQEIQQFVEALLGDEAVGDLLVSLDLSTGHVKAEFVLDLNEDAKTDDLVVIGSLVL